MLTRKGEILIIKNRGLGPEAVNFYNNAPNPDDLANPLRGTPLEYVDAAFRAAEQNRAREAERINNIVLPVIAIRGDGIIGRGVMVLPVGEVVVLRLASEE